MGTFLLSDRTASLCSHSCNGVLNQMQRIGTPCFLARATHCARVSASGFVLSWGKSAGWCKAKKGGNEHTNDDGIPFLEEIDCRLETLVLATEC